MTPIVSSLAVHDAAGALLYLAPAGYEPRRGERVVRLPDGYVDGQWRWEVAARGFVEDLSKLEAALITDLKAVAEQRKMALLSAGGAKKTEYAEKRAEVLDWDTLGGTAAAILAAFNALPPTARALRFAHAIADAAIHGDTPGDAIARFRAGLARSAATATISAIEARACALIKAAPSAPAKRAAAAVTWPS